MPLAIVVLGALTIVYTYHGGMRAVIWTDVLQTGVYLVGGIAAVVLLGRSVDGGWSAIFAHAASAGKLRVVDLSPRLRPALHTLGRRDRRRLPVHGVPRRRPAHRPAPAGRVVPPRRPSRHHRKRHRGARPVHPLSGHRHRLVCVLPWPRLLDGRCRVPDVHPRADASGPRRVDPGRHPRRDHEHALRRDQLTGRLDDPRPLSADHAPVTGGSRRPPGR